MAMTYGIENEFLRVSINQLGAELVSIWSKTRHEELLWQGEAWQGRAPILFPIVGNLPNGQYQAKGQTYALPRHGFARNSRFELRTHDSQRVVLGLRDSEQSRLVYPYCFDLSVSYTLDKDTVKVRFDVLNDQEEALLFSLGFHPAFSVSHDVDLIFEDSPQHYCYGNQGFVDFVSQPHLDMGLSLSLSDVDFSRGAIYIREAQAQRIVVKDGMKALGLSFPDVPYLVIWKKPACEFICIEPCFGITAPSNQDTLALTDKPGIIRLASGERFTTVNEIKLM